MTSRVEAAWDAVEAHIQRHRRKSATLAFLIFFLPDWASDARDALIWLSVFAPSTTDLSGPLSNWIMRSLGVGLLLLVLWETRKANRMPLLPPVGPKREEPKRVAPPDRRPKIAPIWYGEGGKDKADGLTFLNEGEHAYDITIPSIHRGMAEIVFAGTINHLAPGDELFCEVLIKEQEGSVSLDELPGYMRENEIGEIPVDVFYRDFDHSWFVTRCLLRLNPIVSGGIQIGPFSQARVDGPPPARPTDTFWPDSRNTTAAAHSATPSHPDVLYTGGAWQADYVPELLETEPKPLDIKVTLVPNTASGATPGTHIRATNQEAEVARGAAFILTDLLYWNESVRRFIQTREIHQNGPFRPLITGNGDLFCGQPVDVGFIRVEQHRLRINGNRDGGQDHSDIATPGIWKLIGWIKAGDRKCDVTTCLEWDGKASPKPVACPGSAPLVSKAPAPHRPVGR
jgi:hypothetical protein